MKRIYLRSSGGNYPILIGRKQLKTLGALVKHLEIGQKVLIVSNPSVARYYLSTVRASLENSGYHVFCHLLPHGDERDKSERELSKLWVRMAQIPLERTSTVVALGGGVVGDVAAFAASTYMRGISLVQVPTTLLAQVDSAVGGKTAIDLPSAKNVVGTFHQPKMVVSDVDVLQTMPEAAWRNSFAEIIKYGMISDLKLFELLEKRAGAFFSLPRKRKLSHDQLAFVETVVWRSAKAKVKVVERDERETKGEREVLNYGHTFAHALEAATQYRLPHGEAVALGMVLAARMAHADGNLSSRAEARQRDLIKQVGLPTTWKQSKFSSAAVLSFMKRDKKVRNGKLRFVLPCSIGKVEIREGISEKKIRDVLKTLTD